MYAQFLEKNVTQYLVSLGGSSATAANCAKESRKLYETTLSNSRDPFKECCDHAGKLMKQRDPAFKYKSPSSKK